MSSVKYLSFLAIFATLASTAFAIHCFMCDSDMHDKCGEQFTPDEVMDMNCGKLKKPAYVLSWITGQDFMPSGCLKITKATKTNGINVLRLCYFGKASNGNEHCKNIAESDSDTLSCDFCTGDLCNGSSPMTPVALALVAFSGLARIFF